MTDTEILKQLKGQTDPPVTSFDFSKKKLSSSDLSILASHINNNKHITHLSIAHNMPLDSGLTFKGMIKLLDNLPSTGVTSLDLSHINLTNFGNDMDMPIKLAEQLPKMRVTTLNLAGNQLEKRKIGGLPGNIDGIKALSEALPSSSVTDLDLSTNRIQEGGAMMLAEAFGKMPNLKKVDLTDNPQLTKEVIEAVQAAAPSVAIKA